MNIAEIRQILSDRQKIARNLIKRPMKELRELEKTFDEYEKKERELYYKYQKIASFHSRSREEASNFSWTLRYYIGKKKAMSCPAFKCPNGKVSEKAICFVIEDNWANKDYNRLFRQYCYKCKLSKKEALNKGVMNGVFGKVKEDV